MSRRAARARRAFAVALGLGLALPAAGTPKGAGAQATIKLPVVGVIGGAEAPTWEALRQDLRALGWEQGRTLRLEFRWTEGQLDRVRAFALELVGLEASVIVVATSPATAEVIAG